jgi:hypothetical protein
MTSSQIYAKLLSLRDSTGERHYERIKLASQLLADHDWVADPAGGGGDESKALDRLEAEAFADICGIISLPQLLEIFHHVPDLADWKKAKFNLRKIWADYNASRKPTTSAAQERRQSAARNNSLPTPEVLNQATLAETRSYCNKTLVLLSKKDQRIAELEEENATLKAEAQRLRDLLYTKFGTRTA